MADVAPMLGAILGISHTPKGQDKKRAAKPKGRKTTKGERAVTEPAQQHGELASFQTPKPLSDTQMIKVNAKHELRRATDDWVAGRISTKEHKAVHDRTKHVLSGKKPHEFRGPSGERKTRMR